MCVCSITCVCITHHEIEILIHPRPYAYKFESVLLKIYATLTLCAITNPQKLLSIHILLRGCVCVCIYIYVCEHFRDEETSAVCLLVLVYNGAEHIEVHKCL